MSDFSEVGVESFETDHGGSIDEEAQAAFSFEGEPEKEKKHAKRSFKRKPKRSARGSPTDTTNPTDLDFGNPIFETDSNLSSPRDTHSPTESRERDMVEFDNPANPPIVIAVAAKSTKWRSARESILLAEALQAKGDLIGAAKIHVEALEKHRKELGDSHQSGLARVHLAGDTKTFRFFHYTYVGC
jgi:hypothetical protein